MRGGDASSACPVLHVDVDAFYAAVALRDRPELRDAPVVVAGGGRGVVLCASYPARRHGVRSAMSVVHARRLCPSLVVVPPDFAAFSRASASVLEAFRSVTPRVEVVSLEEAFLDVRGAHRHGTPLQLAQRLRALVHDEQGLTCSVGVAPTRSVAKVASRRAKPDGVVVVPPEEVAAFLRPLDVGALWGVGDKTRERLHRLGLRTVGDLADAPLELLEGRLGPGAARQLQTLARGEDRREVRDRRGPTEPDRSTGADATLARDTTDRAVLHRELLRLSARLTGRMRRGGVVGRTLTLKVRYSDFTTLTRSRTLPEPTDVTQEVYRTATDLLDALLDRPGSRGRGVRLVGVRAEHLVRRSEVHHQLVLGEPEHGWAEADRAVDRATGRFGAAAVRPASLLPGAPDRRPA
ncbi:DNA polymerase IV [Nocardioides perillae]|uniref:DNA polymerase IV n=1 Tax=Nocardioides perillae TaxID=1119534 RepID=A0A7Y9RTW7_9ACTN|nr:DNA polymerase-4 [Nocardioides perillae]